MQRPIAWMLCAMMLCSVQTFGCDVCGCSSPAGSLGILPQTYGHFAGLRYQFQRYESRHPAEVGKPPQTAQDHFQSMTVWGRYCPSKRWQLYGFVPYVSNVVKGKSGTEHYRGIGDIQVLANYIFTNNSDRPDSLWRHHLQAGVGIKAPTGRHDFINMEGVILSNMQPGTGSWDALMNLNYTIRKNAWGVNTDASVRIPATNDRDYRYGNKLSAQFSMFRMIKNNHLPKLSLVPQAGIRMETSAKDYSSSKYNIRNTYSGGSFYYAVAGVAVYQGALGFTASGFLPVASQYAGGLVTAKPRAELQLQYLF